MATMESTELGQCFSSHGAGLVLYARQWLPTDVAEDVVQEVFLRLMTRPLRPQEIRAWLYRSVRNAAIDRLRKRTRRQRHEQERAAGRSTWFEESPDQSLDAAMIQDQLAGLPIEQREIIVMRVWGGLTFEEASEATATSVSTLFSRYRAGLAALRERMGVSCQTNSRR